MSHREEIIAQLKDIPAMPVVVGKLRQLLSDPNVDFKKLADVLRYDPGMTANILRLVNSAYFGFMSKVDSVQQGIARLGTKRMYELVLAAAVGPVFQRSIKGYDLPSGALWKHSIAVAIGTEQLALLLNIRVPDYAFTAGLLHDIGKIILGTFIEVDTEPIMQLVEQEGIPFDVAERQILGIDHAEVGALLFEKWNIPQSVIDVSKWHHQPHGYEGDPTVLNLVHLADSISLMSGIGTGDDGLAYRLSKEVVHNLQVNNSIIEACAFQTMVKVEELSELFTSNKKD